MVAAAVYNITTKHDNIYLHDPLCSQVPSPLPKTCLTWWNLPGAETHAGIPLRFTENSNNLTMVTHQTIPFSGWLNVVVQEFHDHLTET